MDDSTDSDTDTSPRDGSGTTGGSAAEGFRQLGRWLKEHLHLRATSDSEEDQ